MWADEMKTMTPNNHAPEPASRADFDTACALANEAMTETEQLRAEYEERLAAANRIIAHQAQQAAALFAALRAVVPHLTGQPLVQARRAIAAVSHRLAVEG